MTPHEPATLAQLAEREQQIVEARMKVRETEQQAQHAASEAARLREQLIDAYGFGDQTQAEKLVRAKAKADARAAEPWPERIAGSQRAAQRQQAGVDAWRADHIGELLTEIQPEAHAAADAINTKVAELDEARRHWHAIASQVTGLTRGVPGIDPHGVSSINVADQAIKTLRRDIGAIPPPLPREPQLATIVPMHDPDPEISEPARTQILEGGG